MSKLLDLYQATQRQLYSSFVTRFEADLEGYRGKSHILEAGPRKGRTVVEVRSDGRRHYWCQEDSGQCYPQLRESTPATDPRIKWFLYDGRHCFQAGHEPLWLVHQAVQRLKTPDRAKALRSRLSVTIADRLDTDSEFGQRFRGRSDPTPLCFADGGGGSSFFHDPDLIRTLRGASTITLEPNLAKAGELDCRVLNASSAEAVSDAQGRPSAVEHTYRIHFAPAYDHQIARLEHVSIHRNPQGHVVETRTILRDVSFESVAGLWVPSAWTHEITVRPRQEPSNHTWTQSRVRRTRILVDPDHDALGSFLPAFIQDGWGVRLKGFAGRYDRSGSLVWRKGHVEDEAGRVIFTP